MMEENHRIGDKNESCSFWYLGYHSDTNGNCRFSSFFQFSRKFSRRNNCTWSSRSDTRSGYWIRNSVMLQDDRCPCFSICCMDSHGDFGHDYNKAGGVYVAGSPFSRLFLFSDRRTCPYCFSGRLSFFREFRFLDKTITCHRIWDSPRGTCFNWQD